MAWLRLDDVYDTNPKILRLTEQQAWRWTRVLLHCAKHETKGRVDIAVLKSLGMSGKNLQAIIDAALARKVDERTYFVNDWPIYNGSTIAEKVDYVLGRDHTLSANDVHRIIGGKRELVLAEVDAWKERFPNGSQSGSREPDVAVPDQYPSCARANPSPSPNSIDESLPSFQSHLGAEPVGKEGRGFDLSNILGDVA